MAKKQNTDKQNKSDIVLWGASSFVGQLLIKYLWPRYGASGEVRFALGGRNRSKLETIHRNVNADDRLSVIVGDASDEGFLDVLTRSTKVVVSTVGPYAKYGSSLVEVCAKNGTDYCDLTGEPQWMRRMIDANLKTAEESGARIIHTCGFDSIPSDLGVLFLQDEAQNRFGYAMENVKMRVSAMRGGLSGGTVASILNLVEEVRRDPEIANIAKNPYALAPEGMRKGVRQENVGTLEYDRDLQKWVGPFIMAAVNTKVVHRSNALLGYPWGKEFRYDEAMVMGAGIKGALRAATLAGGLGAFFLGAVLSPTRFLMKATVLPKPGEGPSPKEQETGFYKLHFIGKDQKGNQLQVRVTGDRDPGYGSTSKMLGESALCLLKDIAPEELPGGFWTPATAMGQKLMARLTSNAGISFEVVEESS
jgi:short subunit dehydrogenase-like uncharacterized protein